MQDRQQGLTTFVQSLALVDQLYPSNQVSEQGLQNTLMALSEGDRSVSVQVHTVNGSLAGTSQARLLKTEPPLGVIEYAAAVDAKHAPEVLKKAIDDLTARGATSVLIETPPGDGEKSGLLKEAGFHELQFPYAQPALDAEGSADRSLRLAVRPPEGAEDHPMAVELLKDALSHLWKQWGVDEKSDATAQEVLRALEGKTEIQLKPLVGESATGSGKPVGL
ncbi:MAG TPA: hypothetical protein VEY30_09495 [Myxococcaceae bacterium]|nr:hypothetical protein [Myxococcaceae bacterium]